MAYLGRKGAAAPINASDIPDDSITSAKIVADAVGSSDLAPDIALTGGSLGIPSVTTANRPGEVGGTNASQTAAVGMLIYNTTLGIMQQYASGSWQSISSPPTVSSFTYPEGTALDPAGSTTKTLVITGTSFQTGLTVTIDGTAPTATTRNSETQITITGFPAKAAATYSAGLVVTNPTGLAASADIIYDAIPAWTTAAGSLGSFVDGAYTRSSTPAAPRIIALEGDDTITYAQVSDAGGGTIITSGVAGLTLGTGLGSGVNSAANAGYLTGTLSGDESSTYNFYAKPTDDEGQIGAVRLFNIISSNLGSGGTVTTYTTYVVHTFLVGGDTSFTLLADTACDVLVVAGGGGGGGGLTSPGGGGGGGGGILYNSDSNGTSSNASLNLVTGTYDVTVGTGGAGGVGDNTTRSVNGVNSSFARIGFSDMISIGGGAGSHYNGTTWPAQGGGAGGGAGYSAPTGGSGTSGQGNSGGTGGSSSYQSAAGGGGASGAGGSISATSTGGAGGAGNAYVIWDNTSDYYSGGGGGGGGYGVNSVVAGGAGGNGGGGAGGNSTSSSTTAPNGHAPLVGRQNSGGGGGGAGTGFSSADQTSFTGATGANGIVVIRYAA